MLQTMAMTRIEREVLRQDAYGEPSRRSRTSPVMDHMMIIRERPRGDGSGTRSHNRGLLARSNPPTGETSADGWRGSAMVLELAGVELDVGSGELIDRRR